jgi:hypothetical protein
MNKALLIGINKYPTQPLNGCINDILDVADFLEKKCAFAKSDIRMLTDERATKVAIIERLNWLLSGLRSGDRVVFHYSGHGAQLASRDPLGEVDKLDEVICPVDFIQGEEYFIRDKDFNTMFSSIPQGVHFIWISDSCHSGDLSREILLDESRNHDQARALILPEDLLWRIKTAKENNLELQSFDRTAKQLNLALITGCKSDQTSMDAYIAGRPNGAMTYFLLKELNKPDGTRLPLINVVAGLNQAIRSAHYSQEPQLEGSPLLMNLPFLTNTTNKTEKTV